MPADLPAIRRALAKIDANVSNALASIVTAEDAETSMERGEEIDSAGLAAVAALIEIMTVIDDLRELGARIDVAPEEPKAIMTCIANFHRQAAEAVATLEMVERRIRA